MNEFVEAFDELLACQTEVGGQSLSVRVGLVTGPCIVEPIDDEEIIVAGGEADAGGFKVMMKALHFNSKPERNTPVEFQGKRLFVLKTRLNQQIYEITIGHPANE